MEYVKIELNQTPNQIKLSTSLFQQIRRVRQNC
jgi:hypothetical protein